MPLAPASNCRHTSGAVLPTPHTSPRPVMTTRRFTGYLPFAVFSFFSMYSIASLTVLIFSASSSGISRSKASSNCITSSTTSSESAPRSSWKLAPGVTSASSTCSCSTMICFTFSSTAMPDSPRFLQNFGCTPGFALPRLRSACLQYRLRHTNTTTAHKKMRMAPNLQVYRAAGSMERRGRTGNRKCHSGFRPHFSGGLNTGKSHGSFDPKLHIEKAYIRRRGSAEMLQAVIAGIAVVVGIALGYWIRSNAARSERNLLEQRNRETAEAVAAVRAQLAEAQAVSAARAGFESVAAERAGTIERLTAERDAARTDLQTNQVAARNQAARISQLEAELNNERQNMAEKIVLLETAKQALANQFEALAANILDQKSKTFSEGSQKELGTLLTPLRDQIKEFREKVEQAQSDSKTGVTKLETLIGALNGLNQQLSEDARNLTTALRGSAKTQGDWGELIVRNLLEKAGLREGEQFQIQETFDAASGDERQQ